jgi:phenylpropionate dioxygenase-like ring-hydroxylating dioxygenase large terminal subunit
MGAQSNLESVMTSVNLAKGLPNEHYVSDDVFEEEKRNLLFKTWSGVGFGSDVPEAGDAKPVEFMGMPLLLVRDREGSVGVFQNTCRHRGMILISEPTKVRGAIRCPYHSWCYELSGALRTTPHVGGPGRNTHEDVNRNELGLFRVRSYVWRDVVFVNVSADAPEFTEVRADLMARWAEVEKPLYHNGSDSSIALDLNCNWKLAVENFCESYHLPWVHPGLNSYSRLQDHYNITEPGKFSGQGTLVYRQFRGADGATFPDFEGLPEKWDQGAEYIAVYPNVLLGAQRDHAFAFVLTPIDKSHTQERINLYYASEQAVGDDYQGMRSENSQLWKTVFEEDVFVVEGMQKGRNGPMFDGGKFSPEMDGPTHCFHHWVATRLQVGRSGPDHEHRHATGL